ncbi:unnamed protein product [Allacma fusca]|uniref:Serpin domain-containing protein n=1 Tax=Allacma fusca TaxID=39272 RepID=A0A8J2P7T5_9HEXA|nr:unnamed protein product [Allacma fusca]
MLFQAKHSAVANLVVVMGIYFMVTECPCAPPPYDEPIIYVTLARWENRTVSPRIYYVMMARQPQLSNLNQVQEDPYPYESPVPVHKLEEKQTRPFFSVRNSFRKKLSEELTTTESLETIETAGSNGNKSSVDSGDDQNIQFYMLTEQDRITFEASPQQDKEHIIFKDNISTMNRRIYPEHTKQKVQSEPTNLERCTDNRYTKGKVPRNLKYEDHIRSLHFTLQVAQQNDPTHDNFIFSPLSILNILALLFLGSSDATFDELSTLLQTGITKDSMEDFTLADRFHEDFSEILYFLNNCTHPKVVLETANEIFTDVKYPLKKSFQEEAEKLYGAEATHIDFTNQGEYFRASVNAWVREKTKGKINSIIDSPPSPLTTLALVNAIYFQGTWQFPFAAHVTRDSPFYTGVGSQVNVKLMTNIVEIPYLKTDSYEIVRLPYKGGDTAMYIMLPNKLGVDGLREMERNLSLQSLNIHIKSMAHQEPSMVTVKLPRMRVQSDGHVKDILSNLGVRSLFNASSANFSKMSPARGLFVSSLLHRAVVDISEKGTEAAAVSIATGDRIIGNNPITFNVNRPFIFFIYNNLAETVLFWGRIIKPEPLEE